METILKAFLSVVILLASANLYSQNNPLSMGVKAGVNLSNMSGDIEDADSRVGYQFGVTFEYGFTENLFFQSGLEFTTKGYKIDADRAVIGGVEVRGAELNCNAQYIQLPLHIGYKTAVSTDVNVLVFAGPYLAYGISGKTKLEGYSIVDQKTNTFSTGGLKEFDLGFGLGIGAEYKKYVLHIGYDFGMSNSYEKIADEKAKLRNRNAYLTVGYKF